MRLYYKSTFLLAMCVFYHQKAAPFADLTPFHNKFITKKTLPKPKEGYSYVYHLHQNDPFQERRLVIDELMNAEGLKSAYKMPVPDRKFHKGGPATTVYRDKNGKALFSHMTMPDGKRWQIEHGFNFRKTGIAFVRPINPYNNKKISEWASIDTKGNFLHFHPTEDNGPAYFSNGLQQYRDEHGKIGFSDPYGKVVILAQYDYALNFRSLADSDDCWAIVVQGGKKEYNKYGYNYIGGKWGIINQKGETIFPCMYDDISFGNYDDQHNSPFLLLKVKKDDQMYCVIREDNTGKMELIPF